MIQTPAFTFCPKPSVRSSALGTDGSLTYLSGILSTNTTLAEGFKNVSVSLPDVLLFAPMKFANANEKIKVELKSVNGETIHDLGSEIWSERTFAYDRWTSDPIGSYYYKCFTLLPVKRVVTESLSCIGTTFLFDFRQILKTFGSSSKIEMYIHDRNEKFTFLGMTSTKRFLLRNNTLTGIFLRPEVIHRLSQKEEPCVPHEDYSYSRCMEICFWEKFYSSPEVTCAIPSILPMGVSATKPECKNGENEWGHFMKLWQTRQAPSAYQETIPCRCPQRCNVIEYQVSADPTPTCESIRERDGTAMLYFSFPSKMVPHILEKEMVTPRDLLVGVGGIVGMFLGVSHLAIFAIELICCRKCCKFFRRRNGVIDAVKH
ncbi:unnamed protein product [Darwinula stevensoni]|uniref:Uncharacterized protein n=1 Tax=Darwinula stevensoni TaxID=69355 RepID=A0A7R9AGR9_9CRUS|nr:unnamed protein product [Darwinula stevensoni]CAG0904150.1 unnamed protein product [Darwinula stevensoni]